MFSYEVFTLFFVVFISSIQCYLLNISLAIVNSQTVIACGLSIDIYQSFDPAQVLTCPHIFIAKDQIQLIHMNISLDDRNQFIIESNPPITSPPKVSIKLSNNSFSLPLNFDRNLTYYLSFSSELTCRVSLLHNETICFYYPVSASFIYIEYDYDEIEHGSLILSDTARNKFYIILIIIGILVAMMCFLAMYIICTSKISLRHTSQLDEIIDAHMTKQEAAKHSADLPHETAIEQALLTEHMSNKLTYSIVGDA